VYKQLAEIYGEPVLEDILINDMIKIINTAVVHELIHEYTEIPESADEDRVTKATIALVDAAKMTWHWIPCPKKNGAKVTWMECLACKDYEKHPSCPLRAIRLDAYPRQYEYGRYHVTELENPRRSYFEREIQYSKEWRSYWSLFFGRAVGFYVESLYAQHKTEVELEIDYGDFKVVGHADIIDEDYGAVLEIKCYHTLRHIIRRGEADPRHEFQARAYYTMLKHAKPYIAKDIKKVRVIYFGRTGTKQYQEFDVPVEEVDLETPARILHEALKRGEPPEQMCPEWMCKTYCPKEIRKVCKDS